MGINIDEERIDELEFDLLDFECDFREIEEVIIEFDKRIKSNDDNWHSALDSCGIEHDAEMLKIHIEAMEKIKKIMY